MLALRPDVQALTVPVGTEGEQVQVLRVLAQPGRASAVRVLYLHGTYRHAYQNLAKAAPMVRSGMDVYLPDYRGWGASSPRLPDENSIHEDAWAAWRALQAQPAAQDTGPVRWVIFGHSMGSAVAVRLASRLHGTHSTCALVLESAFTRFSDVAYEGAGWLGRLLAYMGSQRMDSLAWIEQVDPPVWFFHGSLDETVPLALGRRLFEQAPQPKYWQAWALGHSDLHTDPSGRYDQAWRQIQAGCSQP